MQYYFDKYSDGLCLHLWSAQCVYRSLVKVYQSFILLKVNIRHTRTRCEICSKLTIKTPERRQWRRSGVFIVNSEHITHLAIVNFEHVSDSWV